MYRRFEINHVLCVCVFRNKNKKSIVQMICSPLVSKLIDEQKHELVSCAHFSDEMCHLIHTKKHSFCCFDKMYNRSYSFSINADQVYR